MGPVGATACRVGCDLDCKEEENGDDHLEADDAPGGERKALEDVEEGVDDGDLRQGLSGEDVVREVVRGGELIGVQLQNRVVDEARDHVRPRGDAGLVTDGVAGADRTWALVVEVGRAGLRSIE